MEVSGKKPEEQTAPQGAKREPIKSFREGDVSVAIWAREVQYKGKPVTFYSTSFERSYRDRDGTYRYTKNFDISDIGALLTVAQQASEYVQNLQQSQEAGLPK